MSFLNRAFDDWLEQPRTRHALALLLLGLFGLVRFWDLLTTPRAHIDELIYSWAFDAVLEGQSPYDVEGYYYPPAFAVLGAWLHDQVGDSATRNGFRTLNFLALIATLWMATAWWRSPGSMSTGTREAGGSAGSDLRAWIQRLVVAAALIVASPGVSEGFHVGNLSFVASGLAIAALTSAGRRPVLAGTALALSLCLKPLAVAALPLLVLTPPRDEHRQHRLAGWIGGALTAVVWLGFPYFWELLGQEIEPLGRIRTWSLYRLADVLHLGIDRLVIFAVVVAIALAVAKRARGARGGWLIVALTASILATPLLWFHTLILYFPALVMAASLARARWQGRRARQGAWVEPTFVGLGCAIVLYYNAGAIDMLPPAVEATLLAVPVATVVLLAAYVLRYDGSSDAVEKTRPDRGARSPAGGAGPRSSAEGGASPSAR